VRRIVKSPAQTAVRNFIGNEGQMYASMDLSILYTDDPIGFITSDQPCVWFDPALDDAPCAWRSPGLDSPTIEVLLPLSPSCLLFFNRLGLKGYIPATSVVVRKTNRMVRFGADRAYVVRRNHSDEYWFASNPEAQPQ